MNNIYDFIIIGSGFGGSVSAMRLSEKGYSVLILEKGKRYSEQDFPKTNWNVRKYLWAPLFKCFGIQAITLLNKVMVLHGVGVGGGSLVYANTLMTPPDEVFKKKDWPKPFDWQSELAPHYETARKMLGVTQNKIMNEGEKALEQVSLAMNCHETYHATEVGVFFGEPGVNVSDPYFKGQGPDRTGCTGCGACMVGCPIGAKNTLDKNYLYFAEKQGTKILAERTALSLRRDSDNHWSIETKSSTRIFGPHRESYRAKNVILAAGVLGTLEILFNNRDRYKTLPLLSPRLGEIVRTNNESLLGASSLDSSKDYSKGIAIGSAFHPDADTKIENVRYPAGSDFMRLLAVPLAGKGNALVRLGKMFLSFAMNLPGYLKQIFLKDWSKATTILLFMQSYEGHLKLTWGRTINRLGLKGLKAQGPGVQSYYEEAQTAAKILAKEVKGVPSNVISEVMLGVPATAHILGGAIMGQSPHEGVIDANHQVHGYPGLYVCDASVIPCNLAVNPSLTISALAERFSSQFPVKNSDS